MCELLGVSSLHPVTLEISFQQLIRRAEIANPDGWGAVFYEQNDAYVFREPRPASDSAVARLLADCGVASRLILCHIRNATTGPVELRNTHPFVREIGGRLNSFAFNGNVPGVFDLDLALDRFSPLGDTDGEFAFCWLIEQLAQTIDAGGWEQKAQALQSFGDQLASMGPANFLYSDSNRLFAYASRRTHADAVRSPGLYYNTRHCEGQRKAVSCAGLAVNSLADEEQTLTVVASVPLGDGNWVPFEENQLIVFDKGEKLFDYSSASR
jgi:predicted glutamine amidotransferase